MQSGDIYRGRGGNPARPSHLDYADAGDVRHWGQYPAWIHIAWYFLGISMSKVSLAAKGADSVIRWSAGLVLLIAGFYFLIKFYPD